MMDDRVEEAYKPRGTLQPRWSSSDDGCWDIWQMAWFGDGTPLLMVEVVVERRLVVFGTYDICIDGM